MEDTQNVPAVAPVATTPAPNDQRSPSAARTFRINRGRPGGPGGNRGGAGGRGGNGGRFGGRGGRRDSRSDIPEQSDYEEKSIEIARVTRVTAGGKRMRFRALGIVGNRKGRVGFGIAKGVDVAAATSKAFTKARKSLITVPLVNETIPHEIRMKFCSAYILLKPAPKGTGVKAGGAVRQVLEIAGVPNITAKILGSSNKVNNVKATIDALRELRVPAKNAETEHKSDAKALAE
jgi:small subunit ribosomal protein S5